MKEWLGNMAIAGVLILLMLFGACGLYENYRTSAGCEVYPDTYKCVQARNNNMEDRIASMLDQAMSQAPVDIVASGKLSIRGVTRSNTGSYELYFGAEASDIWKKIDYSRRAKNLSDADNIIIFYEEHLDVTPYAGGRISGFRKKITVIIMNVANNSMLRGQTFTGGPPPTALLT